MLKWLMMLGCWCFAGLLVVAEPVSGPLNAGYVFTDENVRIALPNASGNVAYTVKTITPQGWGETSTGTATVADGGVLLAPRCEGIHIVTFQLPVPVEARFLAMTPPPPVRQTLARHNLPFSAKKLFAKHPYKILAMGDSVTFTGDYETMLVKLLQRATGNSQISFLDRSYPGRSVDAAVRFYPEDVLATKPDIGLLMYGLNDQGAGCSLLAYREQYAWIAQHLAQQQADTVFMTPTPDVSLAPDHPVYGRYLFRTIAYADTLIPLAQSLHIPLADTFHAIWQNGGATLEATGKALWPLYPHSFSEQMTSMLETQGEGDGVHCNALAHLLIARTVFNAMMGIAPPAAPLSVSAQSTWTPSGMVSRVIVTNASHSVRTGKLTAYPLYDDEIDAPAPMKYSLGVGKHLTFELRWPKLISPSSLLQYPANLLNEVGAQRFVLLDSHDGGSRIYCVAAPTAVDADYVRERQVVSDNTAIVHLREGRKVSTLRVPIPADKDFGRIPLVQQVGHGNTASVVAAELAYVRYARAVAGEATVDGALDEWTGQSWITIGDPLQARWTQGIIDGRTTPQECYLRMAFKAGKHGVFIAVQATGSVRNDRLTIFFDPRTPDLLGAIGRYYWANGNFVENGPFALSKGETSKTATGMTGIWRASDNGANIEMFIPYDLMETTRWPSTGDLGFSLWWSHQNVKDGKMTQLLWSEDAHPWNPRWYGVVRLDDGSRHPLPYMVRIK